MKNDCNGNNGIMRRTTTTSTQAHTGTIHLLPNYLPTATFIHSIFGLLGTYRIVSYRICLV
jgi:hypothetical protein